MAENYSFIASLENFHHLTITDNLLLINTSVILFPDCSTMQETQVRNSKCLKEWWALGYSYVLDFLLKIICLIHYEGALLVF